MTLDFDYILLNLILLLTFIIAGRNVSKGRSFWESASWCILAFTLVQGLRYGRGNDYLHYADIFAGKDTNTSYLFSIVNNYLSLIGFTKYSCFLFYAFVFSLCGMIFMKRYKNYAKWLFPLFLIAYLYFEEYQIRQAFSYSFLFLYMKVLFDTSFSNTKLILKCRRILQCIIWGGICIALHPANMFIVALISGFYIFIYKPIPYYYAIPIYVSCVYILPSLINFEQYNIILKFTPNIDLFNDYTDRAELFFSEDAKEELYKRNIYVQLFETIGVSTLIYLAYAIQRKQDINKPIGALYNAFIVGICVLSLFREIELLNRIGYDISLVWCFVLAYVLYNKSTLSPTQKKLSILLLWFMYEYFKYLLIPGDMTQFIWDAPEYVHFI